MFTSLIVFILTFIVPFVLTLQAIQFYSRSTSNKKTTQYDGIVLRVVIPWLRYWLCYILLHYFLALPVVKQIVELLPLSELGICLFKVWLYLPKYQGSKIIVDGVLLSSFKVTSGGKFYYVNFLEYVDSFFLFLVKKLDIVVSGLEKNKLISSNSIYSNLKFQTVELNVLIKDDYSGSTLSCILFKFIDKEGDLEQLKAKFDNTIGSMHAFFFKMGNFKADAVESTYGDPGPSLTSREQLIQRSVSLPTLGENDDSLKTYVTKMVSESSLFSSGGNNRKSARSKKSYGDLKKNL